MPRSARAIPDFVITMAKASNHASKGIQLHKDAPNNWLPSHLTSLYDPADNPSSITLQRFQHVLATIAFLATLPLSYFT